MVPIKLRYNMWYGAARGVEKVVSTSAWRKARDMHNTTVRRTFYSNLLFSIDDVAIEFRQKPGWNKGVTTWIASMHEEVNSNWIKRAGLHDENGEPL